MLRYPTAQGIRILGVDRYINLARRIRIQVPVVHGAICHQEARARHAMLTLEGETRRIRNAELVIWVVISGPWRCRSGSHRWWRGCDCSGLTVESGARDNRNSDGSGNARAGGPRVQRFPTSWAKPLRPRLSQTRRLLRLDAGRPFTTGETATWLGAARPDPETLSLALPARGTERRGGLNCLAARSRRYRGSTVRFALLRQ